MAEYWKSTPSYWCKFCSQYVRDTAIERKNHEATAKHQNNIQRNLRELNKTQEREKREKQQAKDEVAKLNGMFGGDKDSSKSSTRTPVGKVAPSAPNLSTAAQRKAHAEQLAALGVELPDELKKEVSGVGDYQVVTEREVQPSRDGTISVNRSLAEILAESRKEAEEQAREEGNGVEATAKGVFKRKAEDDEDIRDEETAPKRKAWGSNFKKYPGVKDEDDDGVDLDSLLIGVSTKKEPSVKPEKTGEGDVLKKEEGIESSKPLADVPDVNEPAESNVKQEDPAGSGAPAVVFKKRKGKNPRDIDIPSRHDQTERLPLLGGAVSHSRNRDTHRAILHKHNAFQNGSTPTPIGLVQEARCIAMYPFPKLRSDPAVLIPNIKSDRIPAAEPGKKPTIIVPECASESMDKKLISFERDAGIRPPPPGSQSPKRSFGYGTISKACTSSDAGSYKPTRLEMLYGHCVALLRWCMCNGDDDQSESHGSNEDTAVESDSVESRHSIAS